MAKKIFSELFSPKESKWSGLSLPMFLVLLILVALAVYVPFGGKELAFVRPNFLIIFTILAVFGVLFGEIGDRIPFWNDYKRLYWWGYSFSIYSFSSNGNISTSSS